MPLVVDIRVVFGTIIALLSSVGYFKIVEHTLKVIGFKQQVLPVV